MADATLKMLLLGEDRSAGKTLRNVGDDAEDTRHKVDGLGEGFGEFAAKASKVMTIAGAVGPAVMMVGSALSAAAAGATAVAGAVGPAAVAGLMVYVGSLMAIQQAAGVVRFALDGVAEAAAGDEEAMKALSPEGRRLARTLHDLQPELAGLRREAGKGMFPGFNYAITQLVSNYLPLARRAMRLTGDEIGELARRGADMVNSGPWRRDFAAITTKNARNIGLMGDAGLQLADASRSVVATGMPVVRMFLQWALGAATAINQFVQAKRASGDLAEFWRGAAANGALLGDILGDLAVGLFNIFRIGGSGQGKSMLTSLEGMTEQFKQWTQSEGGREALSRWFSQGRENLAAISRLIRDVSTGLADIGSGAQLAPLVDQLRTKVLPPLLDFLENASASGALPALIDAFASLAEVLAKLSEHDGSLKAFARTLKVVGDGASWILDNVPGAGDALGAFFTIAGTGAALKFLGMGGIVTGIGTAFRGLATSMLISAGATTTETGAVTVNTLAHQLSRTTIATWLGVKALEFAAWIRSTAAAGASAVATGASTVATKVAAGASKAWAAAQWLLNAALTANPIVLVVLAVAALVAGLIFAYKKSETFRKIVDGAFKGIAKAGKWMWEGVLRPTLRFLLNAFLTVAGGIVNGAAKAFGWVPGIGPKLRRAADWFNEFRGKVNRQLSGIKDRKVKITADASRARTVASKINQYLNQVTRPRTANVHVSQSGGVGGLLLNPSKRATGTAYHPGGAMMVGERGRPEFLFAPKGSSVRTDDYMRERSLAGDGGGGDLGTLTLLLKGESGEVTHRKLLKFRREKGGIKLGFDSGR